METTGLDVTGSLNQTLAAPGEPEMWLVSLTSNFWSFNKHFAVFGFGLATLGMILNVITIDVAQHNVEQNSGTVWMKYLAFWDTVFLSQNILAKIVSAVTGTDIFSMHESICKIGGYAQRVSALNASAHLVAMAIDRALNMTRPKWHYKKTWTTINPKTSGLITFSHCVLCSPYLGFLAIENEKCGMPTHGNRVSQFYSIGMVTLFYSPGHSIAIVISAAIFIYQLKERRKPKPKTKSQSKRKTKPEPKQKQTGGIPANGKGKRRIAAGQQQGEGTEQGGSAYKKHQQEGGLEMVFVKRDKDPKDIVEFLIFSAYENPLLLREVHTIYRTMLIMFLDRRNGENS